MSEVEPLRMKTVRRVPVYTPGESKAHRKYLRQCRSAADELVEALEVNGHDGGHGPACDICGAIARYRIVRDDDDC